MTKSKGKLSAAALPPLLALSTKTHIWTRQKAGSGNAQEMILDLP